MAQRTRAAAIILEGDRVALIRRDRNRRGIPYFLFPGGGVEEGETTEQAVVREVLEETGLEVEVDRLVAMVSRLGNPQFHYLVRIHGGTFGAGTGPEVTGRTDPSRGTYEPVWLPVNDLLVKPVFPKSVCEVIRNSADGAWPDVPLQLVDDD